MSAAAGPASLATLSTHVLDATAGGPAARVRVALERRDSAGDWYIAEEGETDGDGRLRFSSGLAAGDWRLSFRTGEYFDRRGVAAFYPEVTVTFTAWDSVPHYHVPLLLSPFAYSTYRGS
jgi:5-hydroxyisourate hydrolase